MDLLKIQQQLDEVKIDLTSNAEFATLSGANMLPRNWIVNPYIDQIKTGITPSSFYGEGNSVRALNFEFKSLVKKHNIDVEKCQCQSNSTIIVKSPVLESDSKPFSDFSEQELLERGNQAKNDSDIEEYVLKVAEHDFLSSIRKYILEKE
jgi:hypothetical protein